MTHGNHVTQPSFHGGSLTRRMLTGGAIALFLIGVFLSLVDEANPAWGRFWMIRPLVVVTLAGATGGACYHIMDSFRRQFNWKAAVTIPLSLLIYVIGLWMGTVLGLDGTLWN